MSEKGVTVRTVIRSESIYISKEVMRGLRTLATHQDDPLLSCADAVADELLRERLAQMPEAVERQKAIEAFFRQLNKIA